jgi:hypothetical protein
MLVPPIGGRQRSQERLQIAPGEGDGADRPVGVGEASEMVRAFRVRSLGAMELEPILEPPPQFGDGELGLGVGGGG